MSGYEHRPPEHEVMFRLIITRRIVGVPRRGRRHHMIQRLRRMITRADRRHLYTIEVAEATTRML